MWNSDGHTGRVCTAGALQASPLLPVDDAKRDALRGAARHAGSTPGLVAGARLWKTLGSTNRAADDHALLDPDSAQRVAAGRDSWLMARRPVKRQTRAKPKAPPTAERKVYFYRVDAGLTTGGKPKRLDATPILDSISALPYNASGRYWLQPDGNVLCAWVDPKQRHPRMRLATVRRSGLPLLEEAGSLSPLGVAAAAGLYEPIHVMFFPSNVVGVEFNFYGPRPSRIPSYLMRTAGHACPTFSLDALIRQDVMEQLKRLKRLRVLDLKVRASYASAVAEADADLGAALDAAARVGQSEVVHLVLQPAPHRRNWLTEKALAAVRNLAARPDLRENALGFSVRGLDEEHDRIEEIDVLKDELVVTKKVVRLDDRSRAVDDAAAYAAIEEAYTELKTELEAAVAAAAQ